MTYFAEACAFCLFAAALALIGLYSRRAHGGPVPLIFATMILLYVVGSLPQAAPVFGVNPTENQWFVYVWSFALLLASWAWSAWVSKARISSAEGHHSSVRSAQAWLSGSRLLTALVIGALLVAIVNYATGSIPILSGDVNGARLNGNYGVLGRFWPIAIPLLQIGMLSASTMFAGLRATRLDLVVGGACAFALLLNGGRSLLVIPLLAAAILLVERRRPRVLVIVASVAVGLVLVGLAGFARTGGSESASDSASYLSERNLDGWTGSLVLSLETGPRVMSLALNAIHSGTTGGAVLFGDIENFLDPSVQRSDRFVTLLIGQDPDSVGGLPPTLWGGFALDYGWPGIALAAVVIGVGLPALRRRFVNRTTPANALLYSYLGAYVVLSVYSYISVRPSIIVVVIAALVLRERGASNVETNIDSVQVSPVSWGSRKPY